MCISHDCILHRTGPQARSPPHISQQRKHGRLSAYVQRAQVHGAPSSESIAIGMGSRDGAGAATSISTSESPRSR